MMCVMWFAVTGPSNVPHRIAEAAARPMISHIDPVFYEVSSVKRAKLRDQP